MKKICCLIFYLLLSSSFAAALTLSEQREVYKQAVELQKQQLWPQAVQKANLIPHYPLHYLLDYQRLKNNFNQDSLAEIQAFINSNAKHKISNDLQRQYLYYLAKHEYWADFLSFYPRLPNSTDLKCYHFQAKIAQGEQDKIWPDVQKVWLTGTSLPNACDSVLQYYLAEEKISQQLIWQRFKLAYQKNQRSLLNYLITLMDDSNTQLAEQLYQLNKTPQKILTGNLFTSRKQNHYSLLTATIKQLARKDINLGIEAYIRYDKKIVFNSAEKAGLKKYLISRILISDKTELFSWLDKELLDLNDDALIERRIRYAIKLDNWSDIEYWLKQLSAEQKQQSKWLYWQARVLENQQQQNKANSLYQKLAGQRTYYGFLAAQKLDLDYQFNAQIVTDKLQSLEHLHSQLAHIEELYFQRHISLLKREWDALLTRQDTSLQKQLGLYANKKGWAHLSVLASIRSKSWNALNIRFPEVKPELFEDNANKYQLAPSYIYAITRQESAFDEFANSPVGARGYMQLMPATASETARKIGLKNYKKKSQLTEGKINLQLGSAYFNMLLKRYQGNRILATAAYNAGPHRVDRWQGNKDNQAEQGLTMDSWIETIPYKETRRYVKNVLAYNVIYQHILDKPLEFLTPEEMKARF